MKGVKGDGVVVVDVGHRADYNDPELQIKQLQAENK
jgi:hypothetical protein